MYSFIHSRINFILLNNYYVLDFILAIVVRVTDGMEKSLPSFYLQLEKAWQSAL